MLEGLKDANRLLMDVELRPIQGDRFQPTGFADLGAAVYERPDGKRMLLVETAQSMANRLEHTCLKGDGPNIAAELEGLPYVVSELTGATSAETSSLVEAHRINSPYIISDKGFQEKFTKMASYEEGRVLDSRLAGKTLFHFDINSLLHGAFLANLLDGRMRVPRALTAFIEAEDVREVASGGVKNNPIDASGKIRAVAEPKDVYSNVPYHRTEYTAGKITLYFNMDLALIRSYELPVEAQELLIALGLYKIRRLLNNELRLRTACDLRMDGELHVRSPTGFRLPDELSLLEAIKKGTKACTTKGLFASPPVTKLKCPVKRTKESKKEDASEGDGPEGDTDQ